MGALSLLCRHLAVGL